MRGFFLVFVLIISLLFSGCLSHPPSQSPKGQEAPSNLSLRGENMALVVKPQNFEPEGFIPSKYTCQGDDVFPGLYVEGLPEGTKVLAIIVDDPDAPMGTFVHYVAWNILVSGGNLTLDEGFKAPSEGKNDFGVVGYRGPCPPPGSPHRYFFKVYALSEALDLPSTTTKADILSAMDGKVLAQGEVVGLYKR